MSAWLLTTSDLDDLSTALARENLPTDDIALAGRRFYRLFDSDGPIGFSGLEEEGKDLLLRSVLIEPTRRRQGLGAAAIGIIEAEARALGAHHLHLLTTDAADFFRSVGHIDTDRKAAPAAIAKTAQSRSLCPISATHLVKSIA